MVNSWGDPTETALVQYYLDQNLEVEQYLKDRPRLAEIPFDSERKLMTTFNQLPDHRILVTFKGGAPDQLLKRVTQIDVDGQVRPITDADRELILATNHDLASEALRVLAMAYKITDQVPEEADLTSEKQERDMIFVGG